MRILQSLVQAYTAWAKYLPRVRGRGLILRVVDELQCRGLAAPIIRGEEGLKLELGTDYVSRSIFYTHKWEPEETDLLRSITPRGGIFIDVGANIGYFSLLASRWVGRAGKVYAFEPVSTTHARLRRNMALNPASNVTALQFGASSAPGQAAIALESDAGHSHLVFGAAEPQRTETITLTTLDAFVASEGLTRLDVLKIDVEGADFEVVRGAQSVLRTFRPVVLMEVELIERFGASIGDVERFFNQLDYECELVRHRSAADLLCRPRRSTDSH